MDMSDKQEGFLFSLCISIWEKIQKNPSVRLTAFKMMIKTAIKHPDLMQEAGYYTQDQYLDSLSPAARKSVIKMIKESLIYAAE